jgi:hypothetical protein
MSRPVASLGVSMIAAFAASVGALMISAENSEAASAKNGEAANEAAETCLAAPKGVAPAGSHWYYRTDRAAQRKCWYLASEGRKGHRTAAAGDTPSKTETRTPASPTMKQGIARLTEPFEPDVAPFEANVDVSPPSAERNTVAVSAATDAVQLQALAQTAAADSRDQNSNDQARVAQAQESVNDEAQPVAPVTEQQPSTPQQQAQEVTPPAAAPKPAAARLEPDNMRMLPFAIGALAAACFAAGAILYASRRRQDARVRIVDLNVKAPRMRSSVATADQPIASEPPSYADEHDGEEEPRRLPPPWRRRAA